MKAKIFSGVAAALMLSPFASPSRGFIKSCLSMVIATGTLLTVPVSFAVDPDIHTDRLKETWPALGISSTFGRWVDVIDLGYDPTGAAAAYSDNDHFLVLLDQAARQWELVSGIRFNILATGDYPNDRNTGSQEADGIVSVKWQASSDGFSGRAGPLFGSFDESIGHYAYGDGTVEINTNSWQQKNDRNMVDMLVHELGHLIGLGHSDNPASVMYANPYNSIPYPVADDIRAVQAMYGLPEKPLLESQFMSQHGFASGAPRHLQGATLVTSGSYQGSAQLAEINDETPDGDWLSLIADTGGLPATVIVVDPTGYPFKIKPICQPHAFCFPQESIVPARQVKTIPGIWKVYVTEDVELADKPALLHELTFSVNTTYDYNRPPMADIQVRQGSTAARAEFRVLASDFEGDEIEAVWHFPGPLKDRDMDGWADIDVNEPIGNKLAGDWHEVFFGSTGIHTFFVQVNDNSRRYRSDVAGGGYAGSGFQTLLRVTVELSATNPPKVDVFSSAVNNYKPSVDWPLPFAGSRPDSSMAISENMIAHLSGEDLTMRSCVRIFSNGQVAHIDGLEEMELKMQVLDVQSGRTQIVNSREFNSSGLRFSNGKLPDCSGEFEATTNRYSDYLEFEGVTYRAVFELVDEANMILELRELTELGG